MPSITRRRTAQVGRPTTAEADILAATERLLAGGATFTELGVQQICTEAGVAAPSKRKKSVKTAPPSGCSPIPTLPRWAFITSFTIANPSPAP